MIDIQKAREAFNANPTAKSVANVFYMRATQENGRNMRGGHTNLRRFHLQYLSDFKEFNEADYVALWKSLEAVGLGKVEGSGSLREIDFQLSYTLKSIAMVLFDQTKDHKDLVPQKRVKAKRRATRVAKPARKVQAPAIPAPRHIAASPIPKAEPAPVSSVVSSVTLLRVKGSNGREISIETGNAEALQVALAKLLA